MTDIIQVTHSKVTLYKDFIKDNTLFHTLMEQVNFHTEPVKVFGKIHYPTRQISLQGSHPSKTYFYSGVSHSISKYSSIVKELKKKVEEVTGYRFNACLLNYYPDGNANIGWHSDDESDIRQTTPIVSLSIGSSRDFYLREKFGEKKVIKINLSDGDLLVMGEGTQEYYHHSIPKRAKAGPRISLTFRRMKN